MKDFGKLSDRATRFAGSSMAFYIATAVILLWGLTGPIFKFSDTWQLVINTGTTIITFMMVFLIQHSQNKDTLAIQIKLDELIRSSRAAHDRLTGIEDLREDELQKLKEQLKKIKKSK